MSEIILTDANFEAEILKSQTPALVDFYAEWCGPCRMQAPVVEEIADELNGKIKIGRMDVDQNPQTAQKFEVMSIPTIIIFKSGQAIETLIGLQSKEALLDKIKKII